MRTANTPEIWLAAGVRTPFAKVDGALGTFDAIRLSVSVVQHMIGVLRGATPDFAVWGTVVPNLTWSNIAREILMDAGVAPTIPAFSTVMACSTSMIGAIEAAGMIDGTHRNLALVGGVESMSRVQLSLGQSLSDWIRKFQQARSLGQKVSHVSDLKLGDVKLYIPAVSNRTTGMSMGEHTEITAKDWNVRREDQDRIALESHQRAIAAWEIAFIDLATEGLLMAPAFAIPRLLARHGLAYTDIDIWEIHEAFAAQVLAHINALESADFVRNRAGVDSSFGAFPRERMNPNGGSATHGCAGPATCLA